LIVDHGVEQVISVDRPEWVPVFTGLSVRQFSKRHQPVATDQPTLATCLGEHAAIRDAVLPTGIVLRYRDGRPLTSRRYDHLGRRLGAQLPWVAAQGVHHWLRHTPSPV
jgi:hypothetical protein